MKEMKVRLKVRSYEIDSMGHVNNSVYVSYLEYARVEYFSAGGCPLCDMVESGIFPVLVSVNVNYKKPTFMRDELELHVKIVKSGRSSVTDDINIYNAKTKELVCESRSTYVFIDGKSQKSVPIPENFRKAFELDSI